MGRGCRAQARCAWRACTEGPAGWLRQQQRSLPSCRPSRSPVACSYFAGCDLVTRLQKCRTLGELRALLEGLRDDGEQAPRRCRRRCRPPVPHEQPWPPPAGPPPPRTLRPLSLVSKLACELAVPLRAAQAPWPSWRAAACATPLAASSPLPRQSRTLRYRGCTSGCGRLSLPHVLCQGTAISALLKAGIAAQPTLAAPCCRACSFDLTPLARNGCAPRRPPAGASLAPSSERTSSAPGKPC